MLARWSLAPLLFLVAGCGVEFIEPNPPSLIRTTRTLEVPTRAEPVVFGIVNDLHVVDQGACDRAVDAIEEKIVHELSQRGLAVFRLPRAETSTNCQQQSTRQLDLSELDAEVKRLAAQFPAQRIRPVLLYLNNVALPPPKQIGQVMTYWNPTGIAPLILGAVHPKGTHVRFDATVAWTFTDDPTLPEAVASLFGADRFPLWSIDTTAAPVPLLPEDQRESVLGVKLCALEGAASLRDLSVDSSAALVGPELIPAAAPAGPLLEALAAATPKPAAVQIHLELCTRDCDRFVQFSGLGVTRRWLEQPGCALPAPDSEEDSP